MKQLESPHKSKKSKRDDPFRIRGFVFERYLYGALSLFFIAIGVVLAPISMDTEDKSLVVFLYAFLLLIQYIPLSVIYKSFSWLYIYKEGILLHNPFRKNRFLEWRQIAGVRSSPWGSTLILSNKSGKIKARVYGGHINSDHFLGWFMQERPDIWQPEEGLSFRTSSVFSLFLLMGSFIGFVLAFSIATIKLWEFWFTLGMATGNIVLIWMLPMSIRLQEDTLVLRYPFRDRLISAHDIATMTAVHAPFGYIEMRLKDKKSITLLMFSLGINMLFGFLWHWHASWTRPNLARGSWGPGRVRIPRRPTTLPLLHPPDD